jgi:hypothetical protein
MPLMGATASVPDAAIGCDGGVRGAAGENVLVSSADHRAELDQHPVAGGLDDPPAMLGDERISGGAMLAQCLRRARFVEPHQAAVTRHIGARIAARRRVAAMVDPARGFSRRD